MLRCSQIRAGGPLVLFHGSIGAMSATFVGHYPWFYTYNYLNATLPQYDRKKELPMYLARNAVIGFCSSAISDTCSNSLRVIKTTTQTSTVPIGYGQALKMVIEKDGISGRTPLPEEGERGWRVGAGVASGVWRVASGVWARMTCQPHSVGRVDGYTTAT